MLRALFGKRPPPDPTAGWPQLDTPTPNLDSSRKSVGTLPFGASLLDAKIFGRPDAFQWLQGTDCSLLYASKGFELEFASGHLESIAFFVGPDACQPESPLLTFCSPSVDSIPLSHASTRSQAEAAFGSPTQVDEDEDETIILILRNGLELEFEFSPSGTLKRLSAWI